MVASAHPEEHDLLVVAGLRLQEEAPQRPPGADESELCLSALVPDAPDPRVVSEDVVLRDGIKDVGRDQSSTTPEQKARRSATAPDEVEAPSNQVPPSPALL